MFLISSYGAPLAQRASNKDVSDNIIILNSTICPKREQCSAKSLGLHSSLIELDGAVNYDYIVTNSIKSLLIGSRCIPNGTHTKQPISSMLKNRLIYSS